MVKASEDNVGEVILHKKIYATVNWRTKQWYANMFSFDDLPLFAFVDYVNASKILISRETILRKPS